MLNTVTLAAATRLYGIMYVFISFGMKFFFGYGAFLAVMAYSSNRLAEEASVAVLWFGYGAIALAARYMLDRLFERLHMALAS